jgi:glycine betaine/proline transport system substrate-binding protein
MIQQRWARLAAGAMSVSLILAACSSGGGSSAAPDGDGGGDKPGTGKTVKIAINPWVGYEANAHVVGHVLSEELGYTVEYPNLKEEIAWQGFGTGDVDVVIENWGHDDLKAKYIDEEGTAVLAGETGNIGYIGWYVPPWLAEENPDILDWENLNKYAENFKTTESGEKGQFLAGDPSFVTNDEALVTNLDLNFEVVYSGSEAALIEAFRTAEEQKQWLIGYFYEPQWFLAQVPLKKVALPEYTPGCDADPEKVACDYPEYILDKIVSKTFSEEGGAAFEVVKNFTWTNDDQNVVADYITNGGMSPDEAAAKWAADNEDVWKAWLPAS